MKKNLTIFRISPPKIFFICVLFAIFSETSLGISVDSENYASIFSQSNSFHLMDIVWGHALNNESKLQLALDNIKINGLEADVIFSNTKQVPVMAHPPAIDGDMSLVTYLQKIYESGFLSRATSSSKNIVKLDFKSTEAFEKSLSYIESFNEKMGPSNIFMLNADILQGPCDKLPTVNAQTFMKIAAKIIGAVLSIGWTTSGNSSLEYSQEMVDEMMNVLTEYPTLNVTFPVKASLFKKSWNILKNLFEKPNYTITLWLSSYILPKEEFLWIFTVLETDPLYRGRTYYDIIGFDKFIEELGQKNEYSGK